MSFTSGCPNQTYTDKTAVGIDCREGIVKAVDFQGKWYGMIRRLSHNTTDTWIPVFSGENMDYVLKNEIAGCAYPVGSIYMTVGADPASIFGGTWTLVAQDRFLVGAGNAYSTGSYGGNNTHNHEYAVGYHAYYGAVVGGDGDAVRILNYNNNSYSTSQ